MPSLGETLERRVENEDKRLHRLVALENASGWLFSDKVLLAEGTTEKRILPNLYRAVTGKSMAADKISVMELRGTGSVPDCLTAFKELGLEACAITDFDFALNQAVRLGLIDDNDEHVRSCLEQIKDMSETDSTISIGPNGRAVNGPKKKATHVYRDWAKTDEGKPVAAALHRKLKAVGIWTWPTGDIESVLGLAGDKSEAEWAEFCRSLEGGNLEECVAEVELVEGVVSWLRAS